jgi:hypothetical protein
VFADHKLYRAAIVLSSDPSPLAGVLSCRQRSYFSFIPPRFGHSAVLDDAFRALITLAHSRLVPRHRSNHEIIFSNYSKALHSLQSAVNDRKARNSTEVLCATAILALFEVSVPSDMPISSITYQLAAPELTEWKTMESAHSWGISSHSIQGPVKV